MGAGESLLRLLGPSPPSSSAEPLVPRTTQEWGRVVDEALRHGVAPLLARRLQSLDGSLAPPPASIDRLQVAYCHSALRQRTLRAELRRVLLALGRAGIRVVVLKGAHLADVVYDDPALRPMVDIDLLAAPADLAGVERTLTAIGYGTTAVSAGDTDYATHQHVHPFTRAGAVPVEVHRGLLPADVPFELDLEGLWRRARPLRIAEVDALTLSREDLLQHLCLHVAYTHRFDVSLLAIHDIGATVARFHAELDWRRLAATTTLDGTSRFVYCAIALARSMFDLALPAHVVDSFPHADDDWLVVRAARDAILTEDAVELPIVYRKLGALEGRMAKSLAVVQAIWPRMDRMRTIYGLPPRSLAAYAYYAIRPFDLLRRRGRVVGALLRRAPYVRSALAREESRRFLSRWVDEASAGGIPRP